MLRHHIQLFWMHAGEAGTGSVSSPMFRSSGLILRRAVRKCWETVGEQENTLQKQMFILAKFVLLRVRNDFCGGTSEQPPSITRISGVGKSWIVHRSMPPCSSKHRHRLQTFPDSSGDYSLPQTKNPFFMYSNSGIPNEFSGCTLKEFRCFWIKISKNFRLRRAVSPGLVRGFRWFRSRWLARTEWWADEGRWYQTDCIK